MAIFAFVWVKKCNMKHAQLAPATVLISMKALLMLQPNASSPVYPTTPDAPAHGDYQAKG